MNDFLIGLTCFTSLLLFVALIGVIYWSGRRFRQMQQRLNGLSQQVNSLIQQEAPITITATSETITTPPLVTQPKGNDLASSIESEMPPMQPEQLLAHATASLPSIKVPAAKAPAKPNPIITWFTQMNLMVQIGLIVLFFGVAFLVKYAADQGWLSIELRLIGATLLGIALVGIGWRVRNKERGYGLALIGGGIGIVYLTTFAAYRLYELIPAPLAFAVFVVLSVLYAGMSLLNNAQILAFMALVGGLLAPILASSGGGSHVVLFSYYLALNAGILAIAWFQSWQTLNIVSFVLVLFPAVAWGTSDYTFSLFASTEPFLILFFLFYLTISVLTVRRFAREFARESVEGRFAISDVLLLFANPLVTFALQYSLVVGFDDGVVSRWMADTALVLSLIYAGLALWMLRSWRWEMPQRAWVAEAFLFFATFFLAISIPLLYDPHITAAIWAVMGAALHWLGVRRRQGWAHLWGVVVRLLATGAFLVDFGQAAVDNAIDHYPLFTNHIYVGALILSLSALLSAYLLLDRGSQQPKYATMMSRGLLLWGLAWWFVAGMGEIGLHIPQEAYLISSQVSFIVLSCVTAEVIGTWLGWQALRLTALLMLPLVALFAFVQGGKDELLWMGGNWYAWPLAIVAHFFVLRRMERWPTQAGWLGRNWPALYHAAGIWLLTFLLTRLAYQFATRSTIPLEEEMTTWQMLASLLIPALSLALVGIFNRHLPWPLSTYPRWYGLLAALPLAIYLVLMILSASLTLPGDSQPLPYLPVLNPLTLGILVTLIVLWDWLRTLGRNEETLRPALWISKLAVGILAFIAFNAGLARDIHHLTQVPFEWDALFDSEILQTTYAIVWSVLSLVLMFWANRRGRSEGGWNAVWFFGAAVLALTVLKLFIVDLANTGAIARIVSFMGVGLLMIVIAYFAPLPVQKEGEAG